MDSNKDRISWVDAARGYGTFLVILGHIGFGRAHQWIYSFHIPLFFFLSGFSFSLKNSFAEFLKRRIKNLLVPCLCLSLTVLIAYAIRQSISGDLTFEYIKGFMLNILLQKRFTALWYIACLFVLNIICYPIIKYCRPSAGLAIVFLMAAAGLLYYRLGGLPLFWNADVCLTAAPFFYCGYLLRRNISQVDRILCGRRKTLTVLAVSLSVNVVCWLLSEHLADSVFDMFGSTYAFPPLSYPAAFAGIVFMIAFSKVADFAFPRYVGQNSLLYYAWHQAVIWPLLIPFLGLFGIRSEEITGSAGRLAFNFLVFFATVGIITVLNRLIVKSRLKFIVGK